MEVKENGFIYEPVKSYSNESVHVCINICTAQGDCSHIEKCKHTKDLRGGKRMTFIEFHQFRLC